MGGLFDHKMHLVRMAGLFAAGTLVFLLAKGLFTPKGFGDYGHYRAGALADNAARVPVFAGRKACGECHTDQAAGLAGGPHKGVGCEACHGALGVHASAPEKLKPAKPEPAKICVVCHLPNVARPATFKQVDPKEHGDGSGACGGCHDSHSPDKEAKTP